MAKMKNYFLIVCVFMAVAVAVVCLAEPKAENRFEKEIRVFEKTDSKNTAADNAILFVGSSSIRMWATQDYFPKLKVINRGFGGSQISDVIHFSHRIVFPYKPKLIVFYAGDNDVAVGKKAQRVFDDYKSFVKLAREQLPKTPIIFIAIKPSMSRWKLWPEMKKANAMIEGFCQSDPALFYFDAATPLLGTDGKPNNDLFMPDLLHLNAQGYKAWTKRLTPVIEKALKEKN